MSQSFVHAEACPRCGCYVAWAFKCNCGEVHGDVCENCGLKRGPDVPAKYLKLGDTDARCDRGPVMHAHPPAERIARIDAWHRRLDAMTDAELLAYYDAIGVDEKFKEWVRQDIAGGRRRRRTPAEQPS